MTAHQLLEKYIANHPDYWDFDEELIEVKKLRNACEIERNRRALFESRPVC